MLVSSPRSPIRRTSWRSTPPSRRRGQQASIAASVEQQTAVTNQIAMNVTSVADAAGAANRTIAAISDAAEMLSSNAGQLRTLVAGPD